MGDYVTRNIIQTGRYTPHIHPLWGIENLRAYRCQCNLTCVGWGCDFFPQMGSEPFCSMTRCWSGLFVCDWVNFYLGSHGSYFSCILCCVFSPKRDGTSQGFYPGFILRNKTLNCMGEGYMNWLCG